MAVSKSNVERKFDEEMTNCVLAAEKVIDTILYKKYSGGTVIVDFNVLIIPRPSDTNFVVHFKNEIIKRYQSLGWKVTANSDQQEGSWFTFI